MQLVTCCRTILAAGSRTLQKSKHQFQIGSRSSTRKSFARSAGSFFFRSSTRSIKSLVPRKIRSKPPNHWRPRTGQRFRAAVSTRREQ